jgi:hypothetical protein
MMTGSGADIAVCGLEYVSGEQGNECALSKEYSLRKLPDCRTDWTITDLATGKMYNRHCIDGMSFVDLESEDNVFNFDVFAHNPDIRFAVTDSKGYYYFQRENSRQSRLMSGDLRSFRYFQHAEYYYSRFLTEGDPGIRKEYLNGARSSILQYLPHRNDKDGFSQKHAREFGKLMKSINRELPLIEADKKRRILFSSYCCFPFLYELNLWIHRNNR